MSSKRRLSVSLIGAGSVGTSLAFLLHRAGNKIVAVISRSKSSATKCGKSVGCRLCSDTIDDIPPLTDLILIAVPDRAISSVAKSITRVKNLDFNRLAVCHTSGLLTSDELASIAGKGATAFSFHPIQTFPKRKPLHEQIKSMKGISYGIEGTGRSLKIAARLAEILGGKYLIVPKEAKILYHCACVFASNYSVTLLHAAEELLESFTHQPQMRHLKKLVLASVENAFEQRPSKALTGPLVRASAETVQKHMRQLLNGKRNLAILYSALGEHTVEFLRREKRLTPRQATALRKALSLPFRRGI